LMAIPAFEPASPFDERIHDELFVR
jgi:hypothetical protein